MLEQNDRNEWFVEKKNRFLNLQKSGRNKESITVLNKKKRERVVAAFRERIDVFVEQRFLNES